MTAADVRGIEAVRRDLRERMAHPGKFDMPLPFIKGIPESGVSGAGSGRKRGCRPGRERRIYHEKDDRTNAESTSCSAESIVGGDKLMDALTSHAYISAMKQGVAEEVPPVSKISRMLQEQFPDNAPDLKATPVRQFIGMAVKAILSDEGYELDETGIRIADDPVFRSGSTYRLKSTSEIEEEEDLLARFVAMLNPDELRRLHDLVKAVL